MKPGSAARVAAGGALLALALPGPARADEISVGTLADQFDAAPAGGCSLREAVQTANTDADFGGCTETGAASDADTIRLDVAAAGAPYLLTRVVGDALNDDNNDGDLDVLETLTITGNGPADDVIQANGFAPPDIDRAIHLLTGDLTVNDLEITKGNVGGAGGAGILSFTGAASTVRADGVVFDDNDATPAFGGAIEKGDGGSLLIFNSTFIGNSATGQAGGAIDTNADVSVFNSTFTQNSTNVAGAGGSAISLFGDVTNDGSLVMTNSTVSGNQSDSEGAIFLDVNSGGATIRHSTIAGNTSVQAGNGAAITDKSAALGGNASLISNILNENTAAAAPSNCSTTAGAYISGGHNVTDTPAAQCNLNTSAPELDLENTSAGLGPLQDNGGLTPTRAITSPSPAVDNVPLAECVLLGVPPTDQRNVVRPIGPACDAGAFEAPLPAVTPVIPVTPLTPVTPTTPAKPKKCKKRKKAASAAKKRCKRRKKRA